MLHEYSEIAFRLVMALIFGGVIGLERTYHARPAGFRTHALVCLSTCLLMLVSVYEERWFDPASAHRLTIDPTRMGQGVMTGIGFLGAGAIMKEGLTVHGLTTAASIWMMASIGILVGVGFYFPAVVSFLLTLGALSIFRKFEEGIPSQFFARLQVRFGADSPMPEEEMRRLMNKYGFAIASFSYQMSRSEDYFEYELTLHAQAAHNVRALTDALRQLDEVKRFRLTPTVD